MKKKEVYLVKLMTSYNSALPSILLDYVSSECRNKIGKVRKIIDQKNHLYAEIISRLFGSKILNVKYEQLQIERGKYGKPYFRREKLCFNISHTSNIIIVSFSLFPIGIDIEKVQKVNDLIINKFFTKLEKEYIYADSLYTDERFTEIWTKKEAYIKYLGHYLNTSLNKIDTTKKNISKKMISFNKDGYILSIFRKKIIKDYQEYHLNEMDLIELFEQDIFDKVDMIK